jgi:RHS repeat-associated protein
VFTAVTDNPIVNGIEIVGPSGFTPVRVNCGGGTYTDERGVAWSADSGYSGGSTYATGATVNGETVNYTYDSLARLSTAAISGSSGWGLSWSYDGWGNRLAQTQTKGYAPATSLTVEAATNRISTASNWLYDNNGNAVQAGAGMPLTYDPENRLLTAVGEQYGYAPDNKRVWRKMASGTETVTFWLGDRALARYTVGSSSLTLDTNWRHFGGRNLSVLPDRVGSNMATGKRYFPYGEEVSVSNDNDYKFGTYWRDLTGFDYADQRYYSSGVGRFLTADPYAGSAVVTVPATMNLYGYVGDDPTNLADPTGRDPYCGPNGTWMGSGCYLNYNAYEGGTAGGYAAPVPWDASASLTTDPFSTVIASGVGVVSTGSMMGATDSAFGEYFAPLAGAAAGGGVIGLGGICVGTGVCEIVGAVVIGAAVLVAITVVIQDVVVHPVEGRPYKPGTRDSECEREWATAAEFCSQDWVRRQPGLWGGSVDTCMRGQVSERCGGNKIGRGNAGRGRVTPIAPPRRRNPMMLQ